MKLYEKDLDRERDFRTQEGRGQILLDSIWYNVPGPGAGIITTDPGTIQPVMVIGPWLVPMEPHREANNLDEFGQTKND